MNSLKEDNINTQSIVINIECCQNCPLHSWFTHHQEEKYELYFNQMKVLIEKEVENVTVEKNLVPNHLVKIENRYNQEDFNSYLDLIQNKPVQYPRIGSFEITIFNVTIFSKISCSSWPHYGSIIHTLKNIIQEKLQNKVVIHYSVLKNDNEDNQNQRESQQLNQNQGKKSLPSSPRALNGIKIPPIQHISRSNSPRMRNYLLPLESKNDDISYSQHQIINSSFQKEKSVSPLKNLPPINQQNDKKMIIKDQQKGFIVKTNFYKSQNQDEKQKIQANPKFQKVRASSPLQKEHNIYIRKTNLQGEEQNILIKSQNLTIDDSKEENSEMVRSVQLNQERKVRDYQAQNAVKVRFSNKNENEKSQEREYNKSNSPFLKPIQRKQEQDLNNNEKNSVGLICDMKIKTVKLPYKTVYSNLKSAHNKNQNQSLPPKENSNSPLLNQKNRQLINNKSRPANQIQNQVNKTNENSQLEEEQEILLSSQNEQFNMQNDAKKVDNENISEESKGNIQIKQKEPVSSNKQKTFEEQSVSQDLKKIKKQNLESPISFNKKNINDTYKKVNSLQKTDKIDSENDNKKHNLNIDHNTKKNTISNLSKIEFIKSDVNSSCSLFSNTEQKEINLQNSQVNDEEIKQNEQKAQRQNSQFNKQQENGDQQKVVVADLKQQKDNDESNIVEENLKRKDENNAQNGQDDKQKDLFKKKNIVVGNQEKSSIQNGDNSSQSINLKMNEDQQNNFNQNQENNLKSHEKINESQQDNNTKSQIESISSKIIAQKEQENEKTIEKSPSIREQIKDDSSQQESQSIIKKESSESNQSKIKNQQGNNIKQQKENNSLKQIQQQKKGTEEEQLKDVRKSLQNQEETVQEQQSGSKIIEQNEISEYKSENQNENLEQEELKEQSNNKLQEQNTNQYQEDDDNDEDDEEDGDGEEEGSYKNQNFYQIKEIVFKYLFKLEQKVINQIMEIQVEDIQEFQHENYQSNISKIKVNHLNLQNSMLSYSDFEQTNQFSKKSTLKSDA